MREKGVLELLQAISEIDDQHVKLMIVGSADFGPSNRTPYVNAVVERVSHLGNRVAYIGYVPNDRCIDILNPPIYKSFRLCGKMQLLSFPLRPWPQGYLL